MNTTENKMMYSHHVRVDLEEGAVIMSDIGNETVIRRLSTELEKGLLHLLLWV